MAVVPLPWLRQQLGTHCRMNCETRISTVQPSDATCDVSVSTIPGALSALEALCDYALYKSTFTLHYITRLTAAVVTTTSIILSFNITGEPRFTWKNDR